MNTANSMRKSSGVTKSVAVVTLPDCNSDLPGDRAMKVLLVGNYLPDRQDSMQIYASMLESGHACARA